MCDAVVDAREQHGLVAERNPRPGQQVAGAGQLRCHLVRVVDVDVEPHRVVLRQHLAELVVDPLGQEDRDPGADPDDLDVGDLAKAAQERISRSFGASVRPIAAGDEDVANLRRAADVVELGLELAAVEVLGRVADDPAPRAVAAVARALGRDEQQDPVGVAVDEAGDRGVAVLGEGVLHHPREGAQLRADRDDLAADRVVGIVGIDERDEVGRDVHPELVGRREPLALVVGQVEDLLEILERVEPLRELPAPVVPLLVRNVLPDPGPPADGRLPVRAEPFRGVAQVDERRLVGFRGGDRRRDLRRVHPVVVLLSGPEVCIDPMQSAWSNG